MATKLIDLDRLAVFLNVAKDKFQSKANIRNDFTSPSEDTYPSTKLVDKEIGVINDDIAAINNTIGDLETLLANI